jgi:alkylation response protein AidB-like acyl-CoA dehydrogenase
VSVRENATVTSRLSELASLAGEFAAETERQREVPQELFEELRASGCFRMALPTTYGGDQLEFGEILHVIETLSQADGATGWTVAILSGAPLLLGFLPLPTFERIYAAGPDTISAGVLAPKGAAVPDGSRWRVSGQWPMASGCRRAEWIYLHCAVTDDGTPRVTEDGRPDLRFVVLPVEDVRIMDTWNSSGLRGTGSHDIRVVRRSCPDEFTCRLFGGTPTVATSTFSVHPVYQLYLFVAAVAIGVAQGALDDVLAIAMGGKRPSFSARRLSDSNRFQDQLGEAHVTLMAARDSLYRAARAEYVASGPEDESALLERATLGATASWAIWMAAHVTDIAYTLGGSSAVYESCPLQRRLRDVRAITQHVAANRQSYGLLGAVLAGSPVEFMPG